MYLAGLSTFGLGVRPALAASSGGENIVQPAAPDDMSFIERAFEMRRIATERGDQPYGAVVVREGHIIGQSWSRVIIDNDPTAHAEMAAIRDAAKRQSDRDLSGAILYSSSRPCPMCEAGAYWAGIESMIHGRGRSDAGRPLLCR
ncbi:MAG: nucleoside deaminase [Rhizobiaceae bacterium]